MNPIKRIVKVLGPGFVTGASDDDPSGIATYAQTGAQFGYTQLWTALFSFPLMSFTQEICGRIGLTTGKGLTSLIRENYPKPYLYGTVLMLLAVNTINIGADLGAMASSGQLLIKIPFLAWLIPLTLISLLLQIFIPYKKYNPILKYLSLSLLVYIITAFVVKQPWGEVFKSTITPSFSFTQDYLMNVVALLGTTISPYLFFWQANEETEKAVEEEKIPDIGYGKPEISHDDIKDMRLDTTAGMLFSQLIMFFIIVTMASTLGAHGIHKVETAVDAAQALKPFAGDFAFLIFTMGIIGTGLLAVPILAGSVAYAIAEMFGWKEGLCKDFNEAKGFYITIIVIMTLGFFVNFLPIPPFKLLYYSAILNGLCTPPLLILIMLISNNKSVMDTHANKWLSNVMGWTTVAVMSIAAILLLISPVISKN